MSWSIPDWDKHLLGEIKGNHGYQSKQRNNAFNFVKDWDIAIDIGANIGLWTRPLCERFKFVWAFEPSRENWEHCHKNLEGIENLVNVGEGYFKGGSCHLNDLVDLSQYL